MHFAKLFIKIQEHFLMRAVSSITPYQADFFCKNDGNRSLFRKYLMGSPFNLGGRGCRGQIISLFFSKIVSHVYIKQF